jgi:hypothetical protein
VVSYTNCFIQCLCLVSCGLPTGSLRCGEFYQVLFHSVPVSCFLRPPYRESSLRRVLPSTVSFSACLLFLAASLQGAFAATSSTNCFIQCLCLVSCSLPTGSFRCGDFYQLLFHSVPVTCFLRPPYRGPSLRWVPPSTVSFSACVLFIAASLQGAFAAASSTKHHFIQCKILGFHGGDYEEWCLLGCNVVWLL